MCFLGSSLQCLNSLCSPVNYPHRDFPQMWSGRLSRNFLNLHFSNISLSIFFCWLIDWDKVSLYSSGWPYTYNTPTSVSWLTSNLQYYYLSNPERSDYWHAPTHLVQFLISSLLSLYFWIPHLKNINILITHFKPTLVLLDNL